MKHYAIALGAIAITTLVGQPLAWSLLGVGLAVTYVLCKEAGA